MDDAIKEINGHFKSFDTFEKNFKKCSTAKRAKGYLEGRLKGLKDLWDSIQKQNDDILSLETDADGGRKYFVDDMFSVVEERYYELVGLIQEYLHAFDPLSQPPPDGNQQRVIVAGPQPQNTECKAKLPKIELPSFSGSYHKWLAFKNLFTELIHNRTDIAEVEKLKYLKSCLSDEAERTIQRYQITNRNYDLAWKRLNEKFDNQRILQLTQVETLIDQQAVKDESASQIRDLLDVVLDCLESLDILGVDVSTWDIMLIVLITRKLPLRTRELWEEELEPTNVPTFKQLCEFLEKRYRTLESLELVGESKNEVKSYTNNTRNPSNNFKIKTGNKNNCIACDNPKHPLFSCEKFVNMPIASRMLVVRNNRLCMNCLSPGHLERECKSAKTCFKCSKRHNTLLHRDNLTSSNFDSNTRNQKQGNGYTNQSQSSKPALTESTLFSNKNNGQMVEKRAYTTSLNTEQSLEESTKSQKPKQKLFPTALIKVMSKAGIIYTLRALLDQCSDETFIKESVARRLGLQTVMVPAFNVKGFNGATTATIKVSTSVKLVVSDKESFDIGAYIAQSLVGMLPQSSIEWEHDTFNNIKLADPTFATAGNIDIMLSGSVYANVILDGVIKKNGYVAQNTKFGWIVSGSEGQQASNVSFCLHTTIGVSENETDEILKKFWEIEEMPKRIKAFTDEESQCEEVFKQSYRRTSEGRVQVKLQFKQNTAEVLGESRNLAVARWLAMERKLDKDPNLKQDYMKAMKEYLDLGHMSKVITPEKDYGVVGPDGQMKYNSYYIPHHSVIKPDSTTTKTRIVFDASAKSRSKVSLNEILMVGPTIQESLLTRIMKWRIHRIALRGDITKMYRQILVYDEDVDYQRLVFRFEKTDPIEDYALKTLTFGTASAPYMAIRTLKQLAEDGLEEFPQGSKVVSNDFHVDDLLTGGDSISQVNEIYEQTTNLLKKAKLPMRKWSSNSNEVMAEIPELWREIQSRQIDREDSIKTLGIGWLPIEDTFFFKVPKIGYEKTLTKRVFLSQAAKLFDPLGWLGPVIIKAKIMFQSLWKEQLDWDDKLSVELQQQWENFRQKLRYLEQIRIPRWYGFESSKYVLELHGFSDASITAYGAVIYVKSTDKKGNSRINLVLAKSRVAPIQTVRLARLELCGGVLLANLMSMMKEELKIAKSYCWTDSSITLDWINSSPDKYKTFVANRIAEIQSFTDRKEWRHVSKDDNPADCLSRGIDPDELKQHPLWWHGPHWLVQSEEKWPKNPNVKIPADQMEEKGVKVLRTTTNSTVQDFMAKFASFRTLIRATARVRRLSSKIPTGRPLLVKELERERIHWIKIAQESFSAEIKALNENKPLSSKSKLLQFNPFLDKTGILRVGGRLKEAKIDFDSKHQIIIPKESCLATLIINDAHNVTKHGGIQLTLAYMRTQYWVMEARNKVKGQIKRCVKCHRFSKQMQEQLMGDLPEARVNMTRAFLHTGVDYAGPIPVLTRRKPGKREVTKGYVAVFVCMCTKAIHLELVSNQKSETFLGAFTRFHKRRGLPSDMYSDNSTTFVGAKNELDDDYKRIKELIEPEMARIFASDNVQWHFIPPNAPHFGGLWEAGVKSMKYHLKRMIGDSVYTYEETTTMLAEIEACLNSRPLCPVTNDPNDFSILTPAHFIIGDNLLAPPRPSLLNVQVNRLSLWNQISQRIEHFVKRWKAEYLSRLQHRSKWMRQKENVEVGDMCIIKDDDLPPSKWLLGRIQETFPDKEGLVRKVIVKTKMTSLMRPIHKISILPIDKPIDIEPPSK